MEEEPKQVTGHEEGETTAQDPQEELGEHEDALEGDDEVPEGHDDADGDVDIDLEGHDQDQAHGDDKDKEEEEMVKETTSKNSIGQRNQATNTTFTVWRTDSGSGVNSRVSLSIRQGQGQSQDEDGDEDKENMAINHRGRDEQDQSMYQTVLMGNDSMTGCAILDSNTKFGNLSIINPTPKSKSMSTSMSTRSTSIVGGVPSTGQFSMQAHAGSMEELRRRDRGRGRGHGERGTSKRLNLWPSSTGLSELDQDARDGFQSSEYFYEREDDYSGADGDEGDGIYPYPALTDTEEGHELELKDFEEQERAIYGSLGFELDKNTKPWDDYEEEIKVMKAPPPKREVSFDLNLPTRARGAPLQASKAIQVQFNESSIIYRSAGTGIPVRIKNKAVASSAATTRPVPPPPPTKYVEKAFLSTTLPMQSPKTATTELRFYSAQKPMIRGSGDSYSLSRKGMTMNNKKNTKLLEDKEEENTFFDDVREEQQQRYEVPLIPRPLRREKLEAFTYTPEPKKMVAHQTAFFSGLKKKQKCHHHEGDEGGEGGGKPHSCYICAPVPEEAIAQLKDKIGLTSNEARRAGYLFLTYLKDHRHTKSVQDVMEYLQPNIYANRHPGLSSRLNTKM